MSFRLGLTGSIGMGKSTTARLFADEGCAIWDADAAVHRLYSPGGAAVAPLGARFPDAVIDNAVSREALKSLIAADPQVLSAIEAIVHPLVAEDRARFIETTRSDIQVFDIPLLFESGSQAEFDAIACVTVSAEEQERRVLARGTMTREQFRQIRDKQMSNREKCRLADYVIETDTLEHARKQVQDIIGQIRAELQDA